MGREGRGPLRLERLPGEGALGRAEWTGQGTAHTQRGRRGVSVKKPSRVSAPQTLIKTMSSSRLACGTGLGPDAVGSTGKFSHTSGPFESNPC